MASYTPNLNLYKPDSTDDFGDFRAEFNNNMDILDQGGGGGDVMDVEVNGTSVVDPITKVAEITSYEEVTQSEYEALPSSKLTNGIAYFIKDAGGGGDIDFLVVVDGAVNLVFDDGN